MKKSSGIIDYVILFTLPVISLWLVLSLKLNYFISILLFYGVPSLWLVTRNFKGGVRAFYFALALSVPYSISLDTVGTINNSWTVPYTIFSGRFWNIIPYEDFLWLFFSMFVILCFYFFLVDREAVDRILFTKKLYAFLLLSFFVAGILLYLDDRNTLTTPYAYLVWVLGLLFVPTLVMLLRLKNSRRLLKSCLPVSGYYFFTTLLFETAGIPLRHWEFTGQYVFGKLPIFGNLIPVEELLFVILAGAFGTITFYHYLTDSHSQSTAK